MVAEETEVGQEEVEEEKEEEECEELFDTNGNDTGDTPRSTVLIY